MNSKKIFLFAALLSSAICGHAQSNHDFGLAFSATAEKKISNVVSFELEGDVMTQNKTKDVERWAIGGSFDFKLINRKKFDLKASAGWTYLWQKRLDAELTPHYDQMLTPVGIIDVLDGCNQSFNYWRNRHRTSIGISAAYKPTKRWEFSLRESVQYNHYCQSTQTRFKYRNDDLDDDATIKDVLNDPTTEVIPNDKTRGAKDRFILRSKLTILYNIKHSPFSPYAACDYGCGLNYQANKWKVFAGTDINLSKQHKLDVYYRFSTEDDDEDPNGHIVGVGYKFKF